MANIFRMKTKTVIPRAHARFAEYMTNAFHKLIANAAAYGIAPDKLETITEAYHHFMAAEALASNPDTATGGNRHTRDTAHDVLDKLWRAFLSEYIRYNSLVSEVDLEVFGITKGDSTRTPAGVPDAVGMVSVKRVGAFRLEARVLNAATGKPKNPQHATGSYLYVAVTDIDKTPEHADDFHKKDFSSNNKHVLEFPREQIGRQAHIYARYSNAHGKEGPEGPTEKVIIS
jgi:hypothetical protein